MNKLLEYFEAERGRKVELARQLGLTPGAVSQWEGRVPAGRAADVSELTGIPVEQLRPDIFRRPNPKRARVKQVEAVR